MIKRAIYLAVLSIIAFSGCREEEKVEPAPEYEPIDLHEFASSLRGFNLQGKFDVNWSNAGFSEENFIIISDLGFNFARLPLDYLTYTEWGNWNEFIENEVAEIDQAIECGRQYGVHICLNLHRAPGYSVNTSATPQNQQLDLWTNPAAQEAFLNHWEYFARRYKDIPNNELSFNLINEPSDVEELTYVSIMQSAIDKIHAVNPNRVIFVDGLNWGNDLIMSLRNKTNIIQAIHVYEPFTLTHYKASWVDGSNNWPVPVWPMIDVSNYLYGPWKQEFQSSLVLEGSFPENTEVTINVKQVSIESTLEISLDDVAVYTKEFICGPEKGEDWTEIIETQWGYQNISNKDYAVVLPASGSELSFSNIEGDWMTYNKITISMPDQEIIIIPGDNSWGSIQENYRITPNGEITDAEGNHLVLLDLKEKFEIAEKENIPMMVQEFGVHNETPHPVTIDYLSDVISIFNDHNTGYALWNLNGSLGILNSGRDDVDYESYRGKSLDREMLELLQSGLDQ